MFDVVNENSTKAFWIACDLPHQIGYLFWHARSSTFYFTNQYNEREAFKNLDKTLMYERNCLWRCYVCRNKDTAKSVYDRVLRVFDLLMLDGEWLINQTISSITLPQHTLTKRNEMVRILLQTVQPSNPTYDIKIEHADLFPHISSAIQYDTIDTEAMLHRIAVVHDLYDYTLLKQNFPISQMLWLDEEEKEGKVLIENMHVTYSVQGPPLFKIKYADQNRLIDITGSTKTPLTQYLIAPLNMKIEEGVYPCRYDWPSHSYKIM